MEQMGSDSSDQHGPGVPDPKGTPPQRDRYGSLMESLRAGDAEPQTGSQQRAPEPRRTGERARGQPSLTPAGARTCPPSGAAGTPSPEHS
ncbi:hypothetical protein BH20CHL5_BH20CHL5_09240 [soil metagenome]